MTEKYFPKGGEFIKEKPCEGCGRTLGHAESCPLNMFNKNIEKPKNSPALKTNENERRTVVEIMSGMDDTGDKKAE